MSKISVKQNLVQLVKNWQDGCKKSECILKELVHLHLKIMCEQHLDECYENIQSTQLKQKLPSATSLLHHSIIELTPPNLSIENQKSLFQYLSTFIRNLLHDELRKQCAKKRTPCTIPLNNREVSLEAYEKYMALERALVQLEEMSPRKAHIFSLYYFIGLTPKKLAQQFESSLATIYRELDAARAFLTLKLSI